MSTRSTTHFHYGENPEPAAIVYRHPDGYPESMLPALDQFFSDVEEQTSDTRFCDPNYLAAKWVVWLADHFAHKYEFVGEEMVETKADMLDFISVGVVLKDPGDIEFRYHVWCGHPQSQNVRPLVTYEKV